MTAKDCGRNHHQYRKKLCRRLLASLLGFIVLALFLILLIYLILRPTKPHFILQDATVYAFNLSAANLLTTSLQVTFSSRNPNERIGIYYDKIEAYASYHSQQITPPKLLPSSYQGHKDTTVWSSNLNGNSVPVAPYLAAALKQDRLTGTELINVRVEGRIRWKVGTFISGKYHLHVNCPAYVNFDSNSNGVAMGAAINYQLIMNCHVDV
ncbi:NDR1/HIN1-like protein 1 [Primulina huaijiensis]|uniref:NDR1/HIN1-like protein 1 n=1 Tax=Primulina huaijiensis TaxID=1492673 RepID=UPI003CC736B8